MKLFRGDEAERNADHEQSAVDLLWLALAADAAGEIPKFCPSCAPDLIEVDWVIICLQKGFLGVPICSY